MGLRNMMDNAAGLLRAGALQLSKARASRLCIHALEWHIESVYSVSFGLKCFRDAPPVTF